MPAISLLQNKLDSIGSVGSMVIYTLEQRWEILQVLPILAKKIIFSEEAHFDLGGYVNNKKFKNIFNSFFKHLPKKRYLADSPSCAPTPVGYINR